MNFKNNPQVANNLRVENMNANFLEFEQNFF